MNITRKILAYFVFISVLLFTSNISNSADYSYSVDPDYEYLSVQLGETSINDHTSPVLMWYFEGEIYIAVNSSHPLNYMEINGYKIYAADGDEYGPDDRIVVDGIPYLPNHHIKPHQNNHWTVFKVLKENINLQESNSLSIIAHTGQGHWVLDNTLEIIIPKVTVNVEKTWINGPKTAVDVSLKRHTTDPDDKEIVETVTLTPGSDDKATYTWTGLSYTDTYGAIYKYSVEESDPGEGYTATQTEYSYDETSKTYTIKIENDYTSPTISVTAKKEWMIDDPNQMTDVYFQLYRNIEGESKEPVGDSVLLEAGTLSYTWEGVPKTDMNGEDYIYSVDEVSVPEGFRKIVSDDGLTITNMLNQEMPPTGGKGMGIMNNLGMIIGILGGTVGIFSILRKHVK